MGVCWIFRGMLMIKLYKAKSLRARGGEKEKIPRSQQLIAVRHRPMKRAEAGCGHKITTVWTRAGFRSFACLGSEEEVERNEAADFGSLLPCTILDVQL